MKTILVVEDELAIMDILTDLLTGEGYKVVVARNGQEALDTLEKTRPQMVLSDVMMPIMDGREVCKRIQSTPEYSSIPIVLMSSAHSSLNLDGCKYAAFLKKPFEIETLLRIVTTIIGVA